MKITVIVETFFRIKIACSVVRELSHAIHFAQRKWSYSHWYILAWFSYATNFCTFRQKYELNKPISHKKFLPFSSKSTDLVHWDLCGCVIAHTFLPPSSVILWIELGGKPVWHPLILDIMTWCTQAAFSFDLVSASFSLSQLAPDSYVP